MTSQNVIEVNESNFQAAVLDSDRPVLVDFWAVWCAPCRAMEPHVATIAEKYAGELNVAKCDVDGNPNLADRFEVMNLPTFLLFRNRRLVGRVVGAVPIKKLEEFIRGALAGADGIG